ncbi:MAG: CAP domain-containing protein [Bacillota bacterium]
MKKYIALAALLLVTGCTVNDNTTNRQSVPNQSRIVNQGQTAAPSATVTQASSTSTQGAQKLSMQQTPYPFPDWFTGDWLPVGDRAPAGNRTPADNRVPVGNRTPADNRVPVGNRTPADNRVPAANPPAERPEAASQFAQQVLQLVNSQRTKAGLGSLSMDDKLANMAMVKAQDMIQNNYFDHNSPTYGSPFDMMRQFQITYRAAGENIAKGQSSPEQVMNDWMNSPGHRANILNSSFTKIGVAYYNGAWVQEFIG